MPEDRPGRGRLDSWKEIAAYLNRDVRTVIRWEDKGLPVRRVPGGKRQAVFAYPAEIDAWLMDHRTGSASPDTRKAGVWAAFDHNATDVRPAHVVEIIESNESREGPEEWDAQPAEAGGRPSEPGLKPTFLQHLYAALKGRSSTPISSTPTSSAPSLPAEGLPLQPLRPQGFSSGGKLAFAAAVLLIAGAVAALFPHPRAVSAVYPLRLTQLTSDGRQKMNLRVSGDFLFFNEFEGDRELLAGVPAHGGEIFKVSTPFENVDLQDVVDGHNIVALPYQGTEYERPLWYISAQGGEPGRIGDFLCHAARRSPDQRWIACATGTQIKLYDSLGKHERVLASLNSAIFNLDWSPDSKGILFTLRDDATSNYSLWHMAVNAAGQSRPEKLPLGDNCCFSWAWLGKDKDFVFTKTDHENELALFIKPGELPGDLSREESELPVKIGIPAGVAASGSGNKVYVLIQGTAESQVLLYEPKQKTFQTFLPGISGSYLSFSPDGQWMAYMDEHEGLWRSRIDGSEALRLAKDMEYVQLSSWSPDGRKIAFMGLKPGKPWRIFIVDRNGGKPEEASTGDDNQGAPTWSPDGHSLAYANVNCNETQSCWVNVIDLTTRTSQKVPGSHGFRTARWSPDGKCIAALVPESHNLMLYDLAGSRWRKIAGSVTGDTINWSHDSRFIYADSPQGERPMIERFRVSDGQRSIVASLSDLQKIPGQMDFWFGITPDNGLIVVHHYTASEVYALDWAERSSRP